MSSGKFKELKAYLEALPVSLPLPGNDSKINRLLEFSLDETWVEDVGVEGAVNQEIEAALGDFLPRNNDGIFFIKERGAAMEGLADILEMYHGPGCLLEESAILKKWLKDAIASAKKCILNNGGRVDCTRLTLSVQLPILGINNNPPKIVAGKSGASTAKAKTKIGGQQTKLLESSGSKTKSFSGSSGPGTLRKLETKKLAGTEDSNYSSEEELDDERKGGRKMLALLKDVSKPCRRKGETKKIVRCMGSKGCGITWGWPQDKTRILNHAAQCGYLANIDKDLVDGAVQELARKQPGIVDRLNAKVGLTKKCTHEDPSNASLSQIPENTPPLKRSKTEPLLRDAADDRGSESKQVIRPGQNLGQAFQTEGKKELKENADRALVEFIICCGVPPHVLQKKHFRRFVNVLNGRYLPPCQSTFEDSLVPSYAAAVRVAIIDHLKGCRDLMLSFDGGKLSKKKFYSVHATTPNRQSFCLDLDDVTRISQTGDYIYELLKKTIGQLRDILAFMSLSSYTLAYFDEARNDLHIGRGLISIGETRFGSIYWSLNSVLDGMPAFRRIMQEPSLGLESEVLSGIFEDDDTSFKFQRDLKRLGAVLMPFARAIQCLEAKDTNPSDVYTYWLAVVAHLHNLITKDSDKLKYTIVFKERIRQIANYRFSELIENKHASNIYLAAFVLDPEHRAAPILSNPNPLSIPKVTILQQKDKRPTVQSKKGIVDEIGLSLLRLLQKEYGNEYCEGRSGEEAAMAMQNVNPYLAQRTPRAAIPALRDQFQAYLDGREPFNHKRSRKESLREYWSRLLNDNDSDVLAALAVKLFSAMPISMVDERAMSVVTWLNGARRRRQKVSTVADHLVIRGFDQLTEKVWSL
ncbi:ribonuclease H-like domain-containing protein [Crassisporium funariophilum]|nr:ribonuclease H-like domain-containing protein [Crassisporium funariophilum]